MDATIEVTCRACGREYEPSPDDFRAGTWRVCPDCRSAPPAAPRPVSAPPTDEEAALGILRILAKEMNLTQLAVVCLRCGRDFVPQRRDCPHGPWQLCPACRGDPNFKVSESEVLDADSKAAQGHTARREGPAETDPRS